LPREVTSAAARERLSDSLWSQRRDSVSLSDALAQPDRIHISRAVSMYRAQYVLATLPPGGAMCSRSCIISTLTVVALAGCQDPIDPNEQGRSPAESLQRTVVGARTIDNSIRLFDVDLTIEGGFVPRSTIRVRADVHAREAAGQVEIIVTVPEVESANASSWSAEYRVPRGTRINSLIETRRVPRARGSVDRRSLIRRRSCRLLSSRRRCPYARR